MNRQDNYSGVQAQTAIAKVAAPKPSLAFPDAVALIVGIVIGAGIFQSPALVAANSGSNLAMLLFWLAGGVASFVGALCYAELATTYPDVGGTYYYLKRSFGRRVAFLFAWARMTVIQTGSITLVDYTAPVFWFFFLLSGISLFVLRRREPHIIRPFRVPLYPWTPLLFCLICGYLLYSSLAYTGVGAVVGVVVVAAGIPLLVWNRYRQRTN